MDRAGGVDHCDDRFATPGHGRPGLGQGVLAVALDVLELYLTQSTAEVLVHLVAVAEPVHQTSVERLLRRHGRDLDERSDLFLRQPASRGDVSQEGLGGGLDQAGDHLAVGLGHRRPQEGVGSGLVLVPLPIWVWTPSLSKASRRKNDSAVKPTSPTSPLG